MAAKVFFAIFVTLSALVVEFSGASPTRRQYLAITEASASDSPVTSEDDAAWDDNDEFDLDGDGWFSQAVASPSSAPKKELSEYEDDYSHGNVMVEFGGEDDQEDEDEQHQDAEEDEGSRNDSEFLFVPPKDTRLVLEDDDDDQSGPIKVRHTGRSSYPRVSDGSDNSLESSNEEDGEKDEHPYEFTIDEDDREKDDDDDDEDDHKEQDSEPLTRHEDDDDDDDDDDEFVSEGDNGGDMFDNPEEEAAQVIYGDHVFLY